MIISKDHAASPDHPFVALKQSIQYLDRDTSSFAQFHLGVSHHLGHHFSLLLSTLGHKGRILIATLVRSRRSVLELPSRDLALVQLVEFPVSAAISLWRVSKRMNSLAWW